MSTTKPDAETFRRRRQRFAQEERGEREKKKERGRPSFLQASGYS